MVQDNGMVVKALALAEQGFAVFPLAPKTKVPLKNSHGCLDASKDPDTIRKMFAAVKRTPNIGIATGPASGIWALDVEMLGLADLARLERERGGIPQTVTCRTGGGGRHYYFAWNGTNIRNDEKVDGLEIDVRGDGGYVMAPPSIHDRTGEEYEWENPPGSVPITPAPQWVLDFITGNGKAAPPPPPPAPKVSGLTFNVGGTVDDLATHPGARGPTGDEKGERHATAKRLIGSAIGRGVDPCEIAQQATSWAARCSPPMDEAEVLRLVSDLLRKDTGRVEATIRQEVEDAPLPEAIPWPILDPDALYGLAGEIVRKIEPVTEADNAAVLVQLVVGFGNVVGRGPYYVVEGTSHHTNLFAVLVGKTARGRKGTSEGRVRQILCQVDTEWVLNNIKTGCVSGEGIVWHVRDPVWGKNKKGEEVLQDEGIADKRLLIMESEFAAPLRVCRRETNTLSPTLRSAWDSGILRTLAKNSPAVATDAHISILGHITLEELRRALPEVDGFNGFANRFLWLAVRRSKLLPDGGLDLDLGREAQRLALAVENARAVERMHRDRAAAALWRKAYVELADDDATGLLGAVTSRAEAQVLRLSMIYALLDGTGAIGEPHLRAALALWRYCRASARVIFGDRSGDPMEEKVLDVIKANPSGVGRTQIHAVTGNHLKAVALVRILANLRDSGRARVEKIETAGRPAELWLPCEKSELSEESPATRPEALTSLSSLNSQPLTENERFRV